MPSPDLTTRLLAATDLELGTIKPVGRAHIYIRGRDYLRRGELTEWSSLRLVLRHNGVGTWELETSAESEGAQLLTKDGGIVVTYELSGVETTLFSGSVETAWDWTHTTFRAAGRSDDALLEIPCRPTPALASPPFPDEYQVLTGIASSVMRTLIASQLALAPPPWNTAPINLSPDPFYGGSVTARARFQPLIVILRELAALPMAGGLGFRIIQSDVEASGLIGEIYVPADRTDEVVFSIDLETAMDYEDAWSAPDANHYFALLGDGLGNTRTVLEADEPASFAEIGRRVSRVIDLRDVTSPAEGQQHLAEAIASSVSTRRTSIIPADVPSLRYGEDYGLGDLVTVITRNGSMVESIREVEITLDPSRGISVRPMIGGPNASNDDTAARHIASVQDRLLNLERNWTVPPDSVTRDMLRTTVRPLIGQIVEFAGSSPPPGWLLCNGQNVSRSVYALLFGQIGVQFGAGDGSTTFGVPDLRDRFIVGAGATYALGQLGGSTSFGGLAHTHPGSHSHGAGTIAISHTHSGAPHTHPGTHSHTAGSLVFSHNHAGAPHTHPGSHSHDVGTIAIAHDHSTNLDHFHPANVTGGTSLDTVAVGHASLGSGTTDHHHATPSLTLGTTFKTSGGAQNITKSGSTGADTNAPAASFSTGTGTPINPLNSGSSSDESTAFAASFTSNTGLPASVTNSGSTASDSTAHLADYGGASVSTLPPFMALNRLIYAGV